MAMLQPRESPCSRSSSIALMLAIIQRKNLPRGELARSLLLAPLIEAFFLEAIMKC
jgi:hypothetical protein